MLAVLILLGAALTGIIAALFLLTLQVRALLATVRPLQESLLHSLTKLTERARAAEEMLTTLQAENSRLTSTLVKLDGARTEIVFLRDLVTQSQDRVLGLISRPALAAVEGIRRRSATPVSGPGVIPDSSDINRDNFRAYPTTDSPVDSIDYMEDTPPPPHPRETRVVRPRTPEDPEGYEEGAVLDEKTTSLVFGT